MLSSGDDITMILSKPPAVVPDPVLSEVYITKVEDNCMDPQEEIFTGPYKATIGD